MKVSNGEQLNQDRALRQALLEILPDLALKNGISPSVTEAMAGRLQLPTLDPAFVPEDTLPPEDASSDGGELEEALLEELLPPPQGVERFEAQLASISEQLRQLAVVEDAGQKELAALRRELEGFAAGEKQAAADRVLLSVIRVLDAIEAALRPEDEERIAYLCEHGGGNGAAMAQRYRTELQGVRQDLLELLYQNDTEPFTCGGDTVDPRRQQVLASKTAAYSTPEGGMMVESRRPGYARGERILRREQVYAIQILPTWMKEELSDGQHEPPSPM